MTDIRADFEKVFKPTIRDEALRGALWMAERLCQEAHLHRGKMSGYDIHLFATQLENKEE